MENNIKNNSKSNLIKDFINNLKNNLNKNSAKDSNNNVNENLMKDLTKNLNKNLNENSSKNLTIKDIGFDTYFEKLSNEILNNSKNKENKENNLIPARVIRINKRYYTLLSNEGEFLARIKGKIRHKSEVQSELPIVGDWVLMRKSDNNAFIDSILTRKNILYRKANIKKNDIQAIVSNIDYVFITVGLDNEMPISAIARYLSLAHTSEIKPIIAISKIDIFGKSEFKELLKTINENYPNETVFGYSAKTGENTEIFLDYIKENTSSVFIGASGSGKSTIINYLLKKEKMKTNEVRGYDFKGVHTTTHRELLVLECGGVVIDTPGLRNLDLWEDDKGIKKTFEDFELLAKNCKFKNCTHQHEPDCYILELLEKDEIPYERYEAYITLLNENKMLQKNSIEIKKDRKTALKKIMKYKNNYKKINKNLKK